MEKKKLKENKGITLIALIVTIIVMIIITAVTVAIVINSGLFEYAKNAVDTTNIEAAKEIVRIAAHNVQIESHLRPMTKNDIRDALEKEIESISGDEATVITVENIYRVEFRGFIFKVSEDFNIVEYVQPFDAVEWDKEMTPESAFIWASNNPADGEEYHTIIGYNKEMVNYTVLRIPSRCHQIDLQYKSLKNTGREYPYEHVNRYISRMFDEIYSPGWITNLPNGGINKIEIPETVTKLNGAFIGFSTVTHVELPYSLKEIKGGSFYGCTNLKKIIIPSSVTELGDYVLYNCTNLAEVSIPDTVTKIGEYTLWNSKWFDSLDEGEIYLGNVFYYYKGITPSEIKIKDGTTCIAGHAFHYNKKYEWGYSWNTNTTLTKITLPDTVKEIGVSAFQECINLQDFNMPSNLKIIRANSFRGCRSLTSITFKTDIELMESYAFIDCENLQTVNVNGKINHIDNGCFYNTQWYNNQPNGVVYLNNVVCDYKSTGSADLVVEIKEGITYIADSSFDNISEIVEVKLPSTLKEIGESGFYYCRNLKTINLPVGLEIIGQRAFNYNSKLELNEIPSTVKEIRAYSFQGCTKAFKELNIPEGTNFIGTGAFWGCSSIKKVTTPYSLKTIADYAFTECFGLEEAVLGEGLYFLQDNAFYKCNKLNRVELPSTLSFIGLAVFEKCGNISYIKINQEQNALEGSPWGTESSPLIIWKDDGKKQYTIKTTDDNLDVLSVAYEGQNIIARSKSEDKTVVSMEINGQVIKGNAFIMPNEDVIISNVTYNEQIILESPHNYENNIDQTWEMQFDEETAIKIEFSGETYTESWGDIIWLYNSDGIFIKKYQGNDLAGKTIYLNDNGVKIRLVTNDYGVYYGFKCYITKTEEIGFESMETPHPYRGNCEYAFINKVDNAERIQITFSEETTLKEGDFLNIYSTDEETINQEEGPNNPVRISLNKDNISSKKVILKGNAASILVSSVSGSNSTYGISYSVEKYESPENILESDHKYTNNLNETKTKTIPGAKVLKLTFDDETYVEYYNDYIEIYDGKGVQIGNYTGDNLTGQTLIIIGDTVQIKIISNGYGTAYGYRCTVESVEIEQFGEEYIFESEHPYGNNINQLYEATIDGADLIELDFDSNSFTEGYWDKLYISGEDGVERTVLHGEQIKGNKFMIKGNRVGIRFQTDGSVTYWGFKCTVKGYKIKQ